MIFIINDGGRVSLKMNYIVESCKLDSNKDLFYVFRRVDSRFEEKWGNNQVELAASPTGNFMHFLLMLVKSPRSMRDGLIKRLLRVKSPNVLLADGFLSSLSQVLGEYFDKPARTDTLINFLRKINSPKFFFIDEYVSARIVNLSILKLLGSIVYVSQDVAYDSYNIGNSIITKRLMYKLERDAIAASDLVVASSERDRLKYLEMGAKKTIFYPNIYPIPELERACKSPEACISIVLRGRWGRGINKSLEEILKALSFTNEKLKVNLIGIASKYVPKNVDLHHYAYLPNKKDYWSILNESWVGINVGVHLGGTNERKYDYALAGLVIFSDTLGARGDLLPYEYTYVDSYDLAAKLTQILEFRKEMIIQMGKQNRKQALFLAEKQRGTLLTTISNVLFPNR